LAEYHYFEFNYYFLLKCKRYVNRCSTYFADLAFIPDPFNSQQIRQHIGRFALVLVAVVIVAGEGVQVPMSG